MTTRNSAVVTLPSDTQILVTREFDAPRHLVFKAYTTPELIKRWWAGDHGVATSAEVDLRPGGNWRYVMTANAGFEVAFHGEYQEVIDGERIVSTEVFEGAPDAPAVTTATFTERDGRTTLSLLTTHTSKENRDMHLNSGMESGMQEAMNYLEEVALSLA
ncbi:MAG: SRPBCC family protein [Actinobacteria bacterium]|nr:SRPBCC family protein [Actinomycetota bacterium]MBO0835223.1 SRPBCC family protein [Actinomycetota bacterium]